MVIDVPYIGNTTYDPVIRFSGFEYESLFNKIDGQLEREAIFAKAGRPLTAEKWCSICKTIQADKKQEVAAREEGVSVLIKSLSAEDGKWFAELRQRLKKEEMGKGLGGGKAEWLDRFLDGLDEKDRKNLAGITGMNPEQARDHRIKFGDVYEPLSRGSGEDKKIGDMLYPISNRLNSSDRDKMEALVGKMLGDHGNWAQNYFKRQTEEGKDWFVHKDNPTAPDHAKKWLQRSVKALPENDRKWFGEFITRMNDDERQDFVRYVENMDHQEEAWLKKFENTKWKDVLPKMRELHAIEAKNAELLIAARESPAILDRVNKERVERKQEPWDTSDKKKLPTLVVSQPYYHGHTRNDGFMHYHVNLTESTGPLSLAFDDPGVKLEALRLAPRSTSDEKAKVDAVLLKGKLVNESKTPVNDGSRVIAMTKTLEQLIEREMARQEFVQEVMLSRGYTAKATDKEKAEHLAVRMIETYTFHKGSDREKAKPIFGEVKEHQIAIDKHAGTGEIAMYEFGDTKHIRELVVRERARNMVESLNKDKPFGIPQPMKPEEMGLLPKPATIGKEPGTVSPQLPGRGVR